VRFGNIELHGGITVDFCLTLVNNLVSFVEVAAEKFLDQRFSGINVLSGVERVGGGKVEQHAQVFFAAIVVRGGICADVACYLALPSFRD